MSSINQTHHHQTFLNYRNSSRMDGNNNNSSGYLIEMSDYPNPIRNSPETPTQSNFYTIWSNSHLKNLIIRGDHVQISAYKNIISLNFTLLIILTFFTALITITITEYFCYQFKNSNLHWITVSIVLLTSTLIIIESIVLVKRLAVIQEWEDHYNNSNISDNLESFGTMEEELVEIPPTYQSANLEPPAYVPLKTSSRVNN